MTGGFKLGGVEISYFGIKLLEGSEIGMLPSTRDSIVTIAGKHGAYDFGAVMDVREFNLRCSIISDISNNDLRLKIREFVKHLVDVKGKPRTLELIFDNEPDKKYFVRYSGEVDFEEIIKAGIFTLPLVAFDPFAYGEMQTIEQIIINNNEEIETYSFGNVETPATIVLKNIGDNSISGFKFKYFEVIDDEG